MEDLSFRFLEPETYKQIARLLDEKRVEREGYVEQLRTRLEARAARRRASRPACRAGPKHIYSIVKKMRGKSLDFAQVFDIRALRVIVPDVQGLLCRAGLGALALPADRRGVRRLHRAAQAQRLPVAAHGGARARRQAGKPIEIQIRTEAMHDHAEHGVAAHWAYKEAGHQGLCRRLGQRRVRRQDRGAAPAAGLGARPVRRSQGKGLFDDRIYVLTPRCGDRRTAAGRDAGRLRLHACTPAWATAAAARGWTARWCRSTRRCRTARRWRSSPPRKAGRRATGSTPTWATWPATAPRAKVRAWFNAQITHETIARGREAVEKLLQREGKTAVKLDDLASQLGFKSADDLFEVVGKDEFSLRNIENAAAAGRAGPGAGRRRAASRSRAAASKRAKGGVLVVGVDSLMTQLAKCCKPAPPDAIGGFVTRGKGVSIHRARLQQLPQDGGAQRRARDRGGVGQPQAASAARCTRSTWRWRPPTGRACCATSPTCSRKEKMNVIGVQTQSVKGTALDDLHGRDRRRRAAGAGARRGVEGVPGVRSARRR